MPVSGPIRPGFLRYHPHLPPPARAHSAVSGGVPVWHITIIAAATLLGAAIAVTVSGGGAGGGAPPQPRLARRRPGRKRPI